jgi:hypothetical protein
MTFLPGDRVKCTYRGNHLGTVLAIDDPRAWQESIAFEGTPSQEQVTAHVEWCLSQGLLGPSRTPVLWDFGKVYWDTTVKLANLTFRTWDTGCEHAACYRDISFGYVTHSADCAEGK